MKNDSVQIKLGSIISYLQMAVGIIIGIVYTPIMIRILGQGEYGLYSMASSTISMLSILNLGFTSGYVKFFSRYRKDGDDESIYKLNGLYLLIFSILGAIALAAGLYISNNLTYVFAEGLSKEEYETAKILMIILSINLALSFPMGLFQCIINANQKFVFLKLVGIVRTIISPLVTLPILLMGYKSVAMVAVQTLLSTLVDLLFLFYVVRVVKTKFWISKPQKGLLNSMFGFTVFIALELIVDQVNWNIDRVILGRFKGTVSVAIYTVGATLHNYYQMFSTAIAGVFSPRVHHIYNSLRDNQEKCNVALTELLVKVGRCQFLLLALVSSGIIIFGRQFINFWVGEEYYESYYVALLLVLPSTIALIQNTGIEIQRAKNKHQFRTIAYAIMAGINFFVSVFLCKIYGSIGAAIGTAISLILANGLIMNLYYHKSIGLDMKSFWVEILKLSRGLVLPIIFGILYMRLTSVTATKLMFIFIPVYVIIYCCSMWMLGMNRFEKELFLRPCKLIKKRICHKR